MNELLEIVGDLAPEGWYRSKGGRVTHYYKRGSVVSVCGRIYKQPSDEFSCIDDAPCQTCERRWEALDRSEEERQKYEEHMRARKGADS